jgi:hypothetical protein
VACTPSGALFAVEAGATPYAPAGADVARGLVVPPTLRQGSIVLIQIARAVKLGIFDTEVQSLKVGEIYRVAPGVGTVLVSEGWAREVDSGSPRRESDLEWAGDDPFHHRAAS